MSNKRQPRVLVLTTDDKKLLRRFVSEEGEKAKAQLGTRRANEQRALAQNQNATPAATALLASIQAEMEAVAGFHKRLEEMGYVAGEGNGNIGYNGRHRPLPRPLTVLSFSQAEFDKRQAEITRRYDAIERALEARIRQALLEIVAKNMPGISKELTSLRVELTRLVEG